MCCFDRTTARRSSTARGSLRPVLLRRLPARALGRRARRRRRPRRRDGADRAVKLEAATGMVVLFRVAEPQGRSHPRLLRGLRARRGRTAGHLARRRAPRRQRRAARVVRGAGCRTAQRHDGRRGHRDRAPRRPERRCRARSAGRGNPAGGGAPQGDVLAWQHARRARPGDAAARAARRPEHRGAEERGVRRLAEPRTGRVRRAVRRWRAPTPSRASASEAVFWLAQKGDPRAAAVILQALEKDPVRRGAQEGGVRAEPAQGRRRRQRADQRGQDRRRRDACAARRSSGSDRRPARRRPQAITDRIDNDPNTEVKKRAVFALSQLPPAEGVPLLINVARTNTNPRGAQAGDVLARPVEGSAGDRRSSRKC